MKRYSGYTMGGKEVLICDLEKQCKFYIRSFYWYNKKITHTQTLRNKTVGQYCLIVLKQIPILYWSVILIVAVCTLKHR